VCNSRMSTAFSGNTINVSASNVDMIDEEERLRKDLEELEEKRNSLNTYIRSQEAQDEDAMYKLDAVVKDIEALKQHMKKQGFLKNNVEGGRRKKRTHRRSKSRRSKSRRSKSCAKKSRRSKH